MTMKMISRLSVLLVLIVSLAACSNTSDYTRVIPADASLVVSINLKSLVAKAGLNDNEHEAAKQKILDALKIGMNAATFGQLEKVMKNPAELGIDLESPFYVFSSSSFSYPAVVGKVSNEDKLHASLDAMVKEQICQPVNKTDRYSFTTMNGSLLAFNNSTLMIVPANGTSQTEKAKEAVSHLLKQTVGNSIVKSGAFLQMEKQKSDVNFFTSMAGIPTNFLSQAFLDSLAEVELKDIALVGGLNFEKGKIALKVTYYAESKDAETLMKKRIASYGKTNGTFLKYFPASTLLFFNIGIKGEYLCNLLSENKGFQHEITAAQADRIKAFLSSLNGDFSGGLIDATMSSTPTFMLYADVKNGNALEALYKNKQSAGLAKGGDILKLGEDEYVYNAGGMNIFFGVKDKQLYATNDELCYKNRGKAADKSIKEASYASDMKGKSMFLVINVEAILELPFVKMLSGFGSQEVKTYLELVHKIAYLTVSSEGEVNEIDLQLKEKNENALKQMVDFAKQFAGM